LNGGSLRVRRFALVYHNIAYGKEAYPTRTGGLGKIASGFELSLLLVDHPVRNRNPSGCRSVVKSRTT